MFRVEIGKALRRWRTWLLAAALAGVPVLIVIAVKASPPQPQTARTPRRSCCRSCGTGCSPRSPASPWCSRSSCRSRSGCSQETRSRARRNRERSATCLVGPSAAAGVLRAKYLSAMTLTGALLVGVILAGLLAGGACSGSGRSRRSADDAHDMRGVVAGVGRACTSCWRRRASWRSGCGSPRSPIRVRGRSSPR